jgi:GTPase
MRATSTDGWALALWGMQVPILLGRGGSTLKALGADARKDIEEFLGRPVYLELSVKVAKDWRDKDDSLRSFGYYDKAFV